NFLSHPVVSGFNSASSLLIALSQFKHILGIRAEDGNFLVSLYSLIKGLPHSHLPTLAIGASSLVFLWLVRSRLHGWLLRLGFTARVAGHLTKAGPVVALLLGALTVHLFALDQAGVRVVGVVPSDLPTLGLPPLDPALTLKLLPSALLLSLVSFVGSVSVAQTLAAKRRQRIEPNQELVGLGGANLAAALSGGFPVTGGLSRSVVNFDAGAQTPLASVLTAVGIAITVLFFTPLLHDLPLAVLAATIIVAVLTLFDLGALKRTWRYSRQDAAAMAATMLGVLLVGVEAGILLGVGLSLLLFLWRTSQPHIAVVGQLPGSEHFRNVERFAVVESPRVLSIRVDESLYFPNARYLEDRIAELVGRHPQAEHLVLMCPGVNLIDASALESLEAIAERLRTAGIQLHLSEVKGPVMDRLRRSDFLQRFAGQVFISQFEALAELDPQTTWRAMQMRQTSPTQPEENRQ
ncbi:MAG TPA: SulP family inorganic anion transporter, partial [Pseudomonas sp.]|nr:SulP family inorganic anion transporter [Pseudomonas sp.]